MQETPIENVNPVPIDPLPSWNEGDTKKQIINFVSQVSDENSADYVAPEDRIATFDNDGTLICEQPLYSQLFFAMERVKELADNNPKWRETQPFKAVIDDDHETLKTFGIMDLLQLVMASHTGMNSEEFNEIGATWAFNSPHPKFNQPFAKTIYQPMLEVIQYLKANDFQVFIVSGGGVDLIRTYAYEAYGIPTYQVVGSRIKSKFEIGENGAQVVKLPEMDFIDDKEGKPVGIANFIGKRPIAAFGNSDGDLQMLQYAAGGNGKRLMLLVHHDDAEREYAYDRESHIGKLDKAWDIAKAQGWLVASMKNDFKRIFAFQE